MIDKEKVKEILIRFCHNTGKMVMPDSPNMLHAIKEICDLEPQETQKVVCPEIGRTIYFEACEDCPNRRQQCSKRGQWYCEIDTRNITEHMAKHTMPADCPIPVSQSSPQEPQKVVCPECNGSGVKINQTKAEKYAYWYRPEFFNECCSTCHGTGKVPQSSPEGLLLTDEEQFNLGFKTSYQAQSPELLAYSEGVSDGAKAQLAKITDKYILTPKDK